MTDADLQFAYVLKLIPQLREERNWSDAAHRIVSQHFAALQRLQAGGRLILAGRTLDLDPESFGVVIFRAGSRKEAREIMEADPAVRQGIMTARLFPYRVALMNKENAGAEK